MKQPPPKRNKLRPPQVPAISLPRPALLKRLGEAPGDGRLLSLLRAPLGYGKSTLLAQHVLALSDSGLPWAWYRLDDSDNQPLELLAQLCHALELPIPDLTPGRAAEASLWTTLLNHLESREARFTLVLDDLHLLRSRNACRYLDELLRHPPKHLHLLAACEGEPAIALSHLQRDQRLQTLDVRDLVLDSGEIRELASARGQSLDSDLVYLLRAESEGWFSGVLFGLGTCSGAKLSDFSSVDAPAFLSQHAFEQVARFFHEEVLQRLAPPLLRFLSRLSVVSAFDTRLAAYIGGQDNAAQLIHQLQRQDLFIQQRKGERLVFRLHPLLRRTLYQSLHQQDPNLLNQLHLQAADWLLTQRHYAEAVYQLGRARDFNRLLAALEQHCFDLLREGQVNSIVDFLAKVPGENAPEHFTLAVTEASTVIVTNDITHASACLQRLQRLIRRHEVPERRSERIHQTLAFLRSRLAALGGNFNHGLRLVDRAMDQYPASSAATAVLLFNRAICLFSLGRAHQASSTAGRALAELEALGFSGYTNMLQLLLGQIELAQGDVEKAGARFLGLHSPPGAPGSFYDLFQQLGQGIVLLEQNHLEQAAQRLSQAEAIALAFPHSAGLPWVLHYQACRLLAQGETRLARSRWDEARRLARQFKLFALYRQIGAYQARLAGCEHDQDFILAWLKEWHGCRRRYGAELMPEEWLAYAWVQRHLGQHASARQIADNLHELAEAESLQRLRLDLHLLDATLHRDGGDREAALGSLEQALQLATRHGFGQLMQLEGQALGELFRQLLNPQTRRQLGLEQPLPPPERLARLLRGLHSEVDVAHQPLPEPLTRREQDVLRRMARGQGNQQIADGLYISLSTVKTHINNLFRKLDAGDRDSALQAARALKLVD
ncbi:LuxR C-terminal-related transcriptional regulator [Metapseudomonas furukawaii]|uniref:LuxR C-terminal-related transcriptional regulator n=1 Tax=Metapseudomonas furukawaii TaxID=1149133 RepID=UPI00227C43E5|nr:LuxR C-terminal-related transcriptional regulator [Pseudomonas furukawaii]WAG77423.1 LuxR C-terminal-related transcriptional regulator [Pseudomonas furukawaii]